MKKILIGGGSGLIGGKLTDLLMDRGYEVIHLSRNPDPNNWIKTVHWEPSKQILDPSDIEGVDIVINLAGAGVAEEKWTSGRKELIKSSRVDSNKLLEKTILNLEKKPEHFISASAIGYYGMRTLNKVFTENDKAGDDFLAESCVDWENSALAMKDLDIPTSIVRIGLVLSDEGGALAELEPTFRWGFGAALGNGKQYMPWIHIEDLCKIFLFLIENKVEGIYNGVAPESVTNKEFTKIIANVMEKGLYLPNVPAFALKLFLGDRADLLLKGSRVSSEKISQSGFKFEFKQLKGALKDLLVNDLSSAA